MKNSISLTRGLLPLFGLAAFIAFWQLISGFYSHVVVPSPAEVAQTLWTLAAGELWNRAATPSCAACLDSAWLLRQAHPWAC